MSKLAFCLVLLVLARVAVAQQGFHLLTPSTFRIQMDEGQQWLRIEILSAGFSKVRVLDGDRMVVVPSLHFALRVPKLSEAPAGVSAIRVPGLNGAPQDIRLGVGVIEGRVGVTALPYELNLDLLDSAQKAVGHVTVKIDASPGRIYVNKKCLEKNLGLMDPSYIPGGAVFIACDPDSDTSLSLFYAGAKLVSWVPVGENDARPLGHIAQLGAHPDPMVGALEFQVQRSDDSKEAFDLVYRKESTGGDGVNRWERAIPKREIELELGAYHMNGSRILLPSGMGSIPVNESREQRGLKGRLSWIHHLREGKVDFQIGLFSLLAPLWIDRSGSVTWLLGGDVQGQWSLPLDRNRWNIKPGLGGRYESLHQTGTWDLQNMLGPLVSAELAYRRAKIADELFYATNYSPLQQWGRGYRFNQYYWSHAVGYRLHRSRNYSLGFKFQYEAHQIGNDARGYEFGTYSLNTMIRF